MTNKNMPDTCAGKGDLRPGRLENMAIDGAAMAILTQASETVALVI
jgi:hypothetical protein